MDLSFRDWAGLPAHIVDSMVIKLDMLSDYVRFCGVCPQWRYVALDVDVHHRDTLDILTSTRKKLPMLMFKTDEDNNMCTRDLYNVCDEYIYTIKLPMPYKYRFVGSSLGWLFCVQETMVVTLVNPFNKKCISLPVFENPRKMFRHWYKSYLDYYIRKGILTADPKVSPDSFAVVVLYTCMGKLAFFKSGELSWNFINTELQLCDIIYYKSKLYGVSHYGEFVQIDLDSRTIKTLISAAEVVRVNYIYLVESQDGELLMVKRVWSRCSENSYRVELGEDDNVCHNPDDLPNPNYEIVSSDSEAESETRFPLAPFTYSTPNQTREFKVNKLIHPTKESPIWVEINSIGEQALFVGDNHSVSVSTTDYPGCMPNSIYYTPHHHNYNFPYTCYGLREDFGIFNLEDGDFYAHHVFCDSYKYVHPPIWFVPTLQ